MKRKLDFYTTDWCGDCVRSKAFLNKHNIDFDEIIRGLCVNIHIVYIYKSAKSKSQYRV